LTEFNIRFVDTNAINFFNSVFKEKPEIIKTSKMVSIEESMRGLNGDGWCTSLSAEEQLAHKRYAMNLGSGLNSNYENDREKQMAMFRKEGGFGQDRTSELDKLRNGFIDGFLPPKKTDNVDGEAVPTISSNEMSKIISKYSNDISNLILKINELYRKFDNITNAYQQKTAELEKRIAELEEQAKKKESKKTGFFGRIFGFLSCG
jgi:hypothetical protein